MVNVGAPLQENPAVPVDVMVGEPIAIDGVVQVPVPPNVIPLTTPPVSLAVAVTELGHPVRVITGAEV